MGTNKAFENTPDIDADPEKYELLSWNLEVKWCANLIKTLSLSLLLY